MNRLIFSDKFYVILLGENLALEKQLKKIGEQTGFRVLQSTSLEDLQIVLNKVKNAIALISCTEELNLNLPAFFPFKEKYLKLDQSSDLSKTLFWLHEKIIDAVPTKLVHLMENVIPFIASRLLGDEWANLKKTSDLDGSFTNLVNCTTSALNFTARATCEVNFERLRKEYPSLAVKSDEFLMDLFSEVCNQNLGALNFRLREIGLDPLISLPIGIKLRAQDQVTQMHFMPIVRLMDSKMTAAISIAVQIDPKCQASWSSVSTTPADGEADFL